MTADHAPDATCVLRYGGADYRGYRHYFCLTHRGWIVDRPQRTRLRIQRGAGRTLPEGNGRAFQLHRIDTMPIGRRNTLDSILARLVPTPSPDPIRLPTDCLVWHGTVNGEGGYGITWFGGKRVVVHRFVWEQVNGPVPTGLELDHRCRVRRCANSLHLEPVTHQENCLRGIGLAARNAAKTQCPKGHPLAGDNLKITSTGKRRCATCYREQLIAGSRRYRERNLEKCRERRRLGMRRFNQARRLAAASVKAPDA